MIILDFLIISIIVVFIIDLSGFIFELESMLAKWLKVDIVRIPKPFSCSLCMTFWICVVYMICKGELSLMNVMTLSIISLMTRQISNFISLVQRALDKLICWLNNLFS